MNKMKIEHISCVLDEIEQAVNLAQNYDCKATVSFDMPLFDVNEVFKKYHNIIKVNPVSGEWLKFTFDWGILEVKIYCYEEIDYSLNK